MRYVLAVALLCACTRPNDSPADQQAGARDLAIAGAADMTRTELDLAELEPLDMSVVAAGDMSEAADLAELPDQAEALDMTPPPDLVQVCPILPTCAAQPPLCCNGASCINGYCWNATGGDCDNVNGPLCFGTGSFCGTDHKCH